MKYAVPACLMLLLEWWSFELIPIFSGWIGVKELFVSSILSNIDLLGVDLCYGIGLAAVSLVGNNLGAKMPNKARKYAYAVVI